MFTFCKYSLKMRKTEIINQIKTLLGLDVKLEQATLINGETIVEFDALEEGATVFVVNEDERIPLPEGAYELEDGTAFSTNAEGVIVSVGSNDVQPEEEQEMQEEKKEPKKVVESQVKETHFEEDKQEDVVEVVFTDAHKTAIAEIVKEVLSQMEAEKVNEVEVQAEEVTAEEKVTELSADEKVEPLTHSPEKKVESKINVKYGTNRPRNIQDRVFAKINAQ